LQCFFLKSKIFECTAISGKYCVWGKPCPRKGIRPAKKG
jgi:hypothetical protein